MSFEIQLLVRSKWATDGCDERLEVDEVVGEHVAHHREIDLVVPVDEDIAEPGHVAQRAGEWVFDPAIALQQVEEPTSVRELKTFAMCCSSDASMAGL